MCNNNTVSLRMEILLKQNLLHKFLFYYVLYTVLFSTLYFKFVVRGLEKYVLTYKLEFPYPHDTTIPVLLDHLYLASLSHKEETPDLLVLPEWAQWALKQTF